MDHDAGARAGAPAGMNPTEPRMYCPKCDLEFWAKNVVGDRCVFCGSAGIEDVKDRPRKGFNRRIEEPPDDDRS